MTEWSECESNREVRAAIDEIDKRIIALIGQRYDYVRAVDSPKIAGERILL